MNYPATAYHDKKREDEEMGVIMRKTGRVRLTTRGKGMGRNENIEPMSEKTYRTSSFGIIYLTMSDGSDGVL